MNQAAHAPRTARPLAWGLLIVLVAACPDRTRPPSTSAGGSGAATRVELPFSVLGLIPREVSFLMVGRQVATTSEGLRTFLEPLQDLDQDLTPTRIDRALRREIGVGLLDSGDLTDAGFDPVGDFAVFSDGRSLGFALPVADDQRLRAYLDNQTRALTTQVRTYKGLLVTSWKRGRRGRGAFTRLDRYLLIDLIEGKALDPKGAAAEKKKEAAGWQPWRAAPHGWIDAILKARAARSSVAGGDSFRWAHRALPPDQDLLAFIDVRALNPSLNTWTRREKKACAELDNDLEQVRRLAAGIKLRRRGALGTLLVDLAPAAMTQLKGAIAVGPNLPAAGWDKAPGRGSWHVDPAYLAKIIERMGRRRCGALFDLVRELRWIARTIRAKRAAVAHLGGRGIAAAVQAAGKTPQGGIALRGGVVAPCPDEAARRYFTAHIPLEPGGPSTIKGRPVHQVSTSRPLSAAPQLCIDGGLMRLSVGKSVMESLLGPAPVPLPGRLFALWLEPGRIADVRSLLRMLEDPPTTAAMTRGRRRASRRLDRLALTINRYARVQIEGKIEPGWLRIEAEYRLR